MKRILTACIGVMVMVLATGPVMAADNDIVIGLPNWTSAHVTGEVLKYIGENDLGLKIGTVRSSNPVIFKAMHEGKGGIDVHPEVWMPNQANLAKKYIEEAKTVEFAKRPYEARQGVCATKHTVETLGIKSVFDLVDPVVSKKFDTNGDGKGEFWPGAHGWSSTNVEKVKAREYGYDQFWELVELDDTIHYAKMDKAGKTNGFYLGVCQEPHAIFAMQELIWLEEPPYNEAAWKMVQPTDDPEWFQKSKVATAWPSTKLRIAFSKTLYKRVPEFAKLLNTINMNTELVAGWTYMVAVDGKTPEVAAKEWVDANRNIVDKWLGL